VELGPGTGVFTRELLRRMPKTSKLIVVELNESFLENLKNSITDDRAVFIHDSAEKIEAFLREYGIEKADYIVSSLPLSTIPSNIRNEILASAYNSLRPKGEFIQFQYTLHQRKNLKRIYSKVDISYTPLNFPPAFVYRCVK
jgi:phospholipid N-methyltransferase